MTLVKWNPTRSIITDFDRMLESVFNDGWNLKSTFRASSIPVDISESNNAFILRADFPGFEKKDVSLTIEEGVLRLSAEQNLENESNENSYRIRERRAGSLNRSFTLPENVLIDDISAKFQNGTLSITIPKTEEVKPDIRRVKIG